jgi:hypothetical protein
MTNKIAGLKEISHLYKNYFFDLDGVFVIVCLNSGKDNKQYRAQFKY